MDVREVEKRAGQLIASGMHCSESVLMAIAEAKGIESPLIPRIATGFAGGLSGTKNTCGAVTGAIMALGIAFGRDDAEAHSTPMYRKVQDFLTRFETEFSSINCFDLTQCDLGTKEGRQQFQEKEVGRKCMGYTARAAAIVAELVNDGPADEENP